MPNEKLYPNHHSKTKPLASRWASLTDAFYTALNNEFGFGIKARIRMANDAGEIEITHHELHNAYKSVTLDQLVTQFMLERSTQGMADIKSTADLIYDLEKQVKRLQDHQSKLYLQPIKTK